MMPNTAKKSAFLFNFLYFFICTDRYKLQLKLSKLSNSVFLGIYEWRYSQNKYDFSVCLAMCLYNNLYAMTQNWTRRKTEHNDAKLNTMTQNLILTQNWKKMTQNSEKNYAKLKHLRKTDTRTQSWTYLRKTTQEHKTAHNCVKLNTMA